MNKIEHRTKIDNILKYIIPIDVKNNLIRLGSKNDGGYTLYNNFDSNEYLISIGIGKNWDFEKEISNKIKGISMYDGNIYNDNFKIDNAIFFNKNIYNKEDLIECVNLINIEHSGLILKVDIEGDEWCVFDNLDINILNKFKQIIVEFHHFDKMIDFYSFSSLQDGLKCHYDIANSVFKNITTTHYPIFINANNFSNIKIIANQIIPEVFEITFLRKDLISDFNINKQPIWYDFKSSNHPGEPEIKWVPIV